MGTSSRLSAGTGLAPIAGSSSSSPPPNNGGHNPRIDNIGVGHKILCTIASKESRAVTHWEQQKVAKKPKRKANPKPPADADPPAEPAATPPKPDPKPEPK